MAPHLNTNANWVVKNVSCHWIAECSRFSTSIKETLQNLSHASEAIIEVKKYITFTFLLLSKLFQSAHTGTNHSKVSSQYPQWHANTYHLFGGRLLLSKDFLLVHLLSHQAHNPWSLLLFVLNQKHHLTYSCCFSLDDL